MIKWRIKFEKINKNSEANEDSYCKLICENLEEMETSFKPELHKGIISLMFTKRSQSGRVLMDSATLCFPADLFELDTEYYMNFTKVTSE